MCFPLKINFFGLCEEKFSNFHLVFESDEIYIASEQGLIKQEVSIEMILIT